ncbi:phosphohistidine phosphatase SixA [Sulfurivermis fontis]|uniref:phosphohistidine phosphatase SixA n=1 Tax=Sulfurivermis fontis TaxID=1972068 RepID=UPI000FDB920B|nr:phosphohistidine phosphatase SixA [Sulfurivermis fontis]
MDVLLVRHAKAEEREIFALTGAEDALRPLTKSGAREMRKVARALQRLVPRIDVLASSPLLRALQTADILAARIGGKAVQLPQLAPGHAPGQVLTWLRSQGDNPCVALVGHEPDLGVLAAWLLTGGQGGFLPLKKGGACLLHFKDGIKEGKAELVWAMPPAVLRRIGKSS